MKEEEEGEEEGTRDSLPEKETRKEFIHNFNQQTDSIPQVVYTCVERFF